MHEVSSLALQPERAKVRTGHPHLQPAPPRQCRGRPLRRLASHPRGRRDNLAHAAHEPAERRRLLRGKAGRELCTQGAGNHAKKPQSFLRRRAPSQPRRASRETQHLQGSPQPQLPSPGPVQQLERRQTRKSRRIPLREIPFPAWPSKQAGQRTAVLVAQEQRSHFR